MQTFPSLCIYNFGLPRRTPSPRPRLDDVRGHGAGTEVDLHSRGPSLGGGRSRTDANDDDGDERRTRPGLGGDGCEDLGWAATGGDLAWAATGTHDVRQNGTKGKNARARSVKKKFRGGVHTLGLPSLNAKSLGVRLFLDFANEFETLQTTSNVKFICKIPWRCSYSPL